MPQPDVSVILPCRNEEEGLGECLTTIQSVFTAHNLHGEIIVSDSSSDRSPEIARAHGARLIDHGASGYGIALREGFQAARSEFMICADADMTYDFNDIPTFIARLKSGSDMVIGVRQYQPNVSPWLHEHVGVPATAFLIGLLFGGSVKDPHCGIRAITRSAYDQLALQTTGMEFASEMIVRALQKELKIAQLPTNYFARIGESKLNTFQDGWRHLRLLFQLRTGLI
ncbi:hypothetical protein CL628_01875 [bacterium]|nr:hypothetical protein [bacterium]